MDKSAVRILIIDGSDEVRSLFRTVLGDAGFQIELAGSAREARRKLVAREYHLLVVEPGLPDGDGFELINPRARHGPAAIVMTSQPSVDSAVAGIRSGARDYLIKPLSREAIRASIEKVLASDGLLIDSEERFRTELGRRLREARIRADLTMRALGERIGISQAQISQVESGQSAPSLTTLFRLAHALRIRLCDLMGGF